MRSSLRPTAFRLPNALPWRTWALLCCALGSLQAQDAMELGPSPTREMFPLFLMSMVYQPVDPTPLGSGRWRVSLDHTQANTFEFSDVFKDQPQQDATGRVILRREEVTRHAAAYPTIPLLFYFDVETVRSALRVRFGLGERTDLWAELPFQSQSGGSLDGLIEGVHNLGFEQFGRNQIAKDQLTLVVITQGQLQFFSDQSIRGKTQDPALGLTQSLVDDPTFRLSTYFVLKPPLTSTYGVFRSGWDHSVGLTARWQWSPSHVFYGGAGFIRRPRGSYAYNTMAFGSMRNAWGMHATWEYRHPGHFHPFFQIYGQSGNLPKQPHQKLDRPSLQHDLGFHWQLQKDAIFTFHYVNNITHNENTSDMALGVSLTSRF